MTDKELRRLSRGELLEMLIAQAAENDQLKNRLEQAEAQLRDRKIAINNAGSLAEAALSLNGVFQAAEAAAQQYLENIRTLSGRQEQICRQREEESAQKSNALLAETERKCRTMEAATTEKCARMTKEAEDAADRAWRDAQVRIQKLIDDQAGLRELLTAFSKGSK